MRTAGKEMTRLRREIGALSSFDRHNGDLVMSNASSQSNGSASIPAVSRPEERAAANERTRSFPFRFPRDRRQLGGQFSVEENSRRLLRFFYFERRLMQ